MTNSDTVPVFDGHNDILLRLWRAGAEGAAKRFLEGEEAGHIDLPRARKGGFAGGLCAVYVPSERVLNEEGNYPTPSHAEAVEATVGMAGILARIEHASNGGVKICRSAADIRAAMAAGSFASVFHIEGAEAIGPDLDMLYLLHNAGLRTLGPVWSRPNIFAFGIPFRFPCSPDVGPGMSDLGKALIRACNELRIMVDLSHMNEAGFWEIAKISDAPLVASHSNAHALCAQSRNLTDKQIDAIGESGGLIGINFGASFFDPAGPDRDLDVDLSVLVRHVDHIVERIGIDHVALGSDFDGTKIPNAMKDVTDLPKLIAALRKAGYAGEDLDKICHGNWIRVLERTWGG